MGKKAKNQKAPSYTYDAYDDQGNMLGKATFGGTLSDGYVYDASPDGTRARYAYINGKLVRQAGSYYYTDDGQSMWLTDNPQTGTSMSFGDGDKRYAYDGQKFVGAANGMDFGTALLLSVMTGKALPPPQAVGKLGGTLGGNSSGDPTGVLGGTGQVDVAAIPQDVTFQLPVLNRDGATSYNPAHQLSSRLDRRSGWAGSILGV
jgi:hypothetical protein